MSAVLVAVVSGCVWTSVPTFSDPVSTDGAEGVAVVTVGTDAGVCTGARFGSGTGVDPDVSGAGVDPDVSGAGVDPDVSGAGVDPDVSGGGHTTSAICAISTGPGPMTTCGSGIMTTGPMHGGGITLGPMLVITPGGGACWIIVLGPMLVITPGGGACWIIVLGPVLAITPGSSWATGGGPAAVAWKAWKRPALNATVIEVTATTTARLCFTRSD
jgi:hypothetical protein